MNKIKTETIISSLLVLGYDQVDPLLYRYILGALSQNGNYWVVEDDELSPSFSEFVDDDGIRFRLKEGYTLESNVSPVEGSTWSLRSALRPNEELMSQIEELDMKEIVMKKVQAIGTNRIDEMKDLFSEKEKEILQQIFGINPNTKERKKSYRKKA